MGKKKIERPLYPEEHEEMLKEHTHPFHELAMNCKRAFDFGVERGGKAARHIKQDRFTTLPFGNSESLAYQRGYGKGYRRAIFEFRTKTEGRKVDGRRA